MGADQTPAALEGGGTARGAATAAHEDATTTDLFQAVAADLNSVLRKRVQGPEAATMDTPPASEAHRAETPLERAERELFYMRSFYANLRSYYAIMWWAQLLLMLSIGVAIAFFMLYHETPSELMLRKTLFGYVFMPFYAVLLLLFVMTRRRFEVNDVVSRAALFGMGFGAAYVALSLFNSAVLAFDMST